MPALFFKAESTDSDALSGFLLQYKRGYRKAMVIDCTKKLLLLVKGYAIYLLNG